ncbi:MAG: RNA 2',3'-cyclic phosphodiesterase [Smithellaceae bacterium]
MDAQKDLRAFLAIEPSAEVLGAIARLQEKLKREISGSVSWTRPQGNHLTLKFFGNIDRHSVEDICTVVKKQAATTPHLLLKVEKLGVFPDLRRPRVLWVGTAGDNEKLTLLQNKLEEEFEVLGFPRENRPFRAHLTLGRIKDARAAAGIDAAIKKYSTFTAGEFRATELMLFRSQLTPQGAMYTNLADFVLDG